jgi:WD40 repeat protein
MMLRKCKSNSSLLPGATRLFLLALGLWLALLPSSARAQSIDNARSSDDVVFAVAFSPDGKTVAIARGSRELVQRFGRIELWDVDSLKLRVLIKGFDGPVRSISFSADGSTLLSGSSEFRSVKLQQKARSREGDVSAELKWWDTRTGELKRKITMPGDHNYSVRAIQSPDGKQLVLTEISQEPSPSRFSLPVSGPRTAIPNLDLLTMQVLSRGAPLVKVEMKVVDAESGELKFKLDMGQPGASRMSPDGSLLAVANGKEIKLWNLQTGKEVRKLKGFKGNANAVAFSPDGRTLAVTNTRLQREYAEDVVKIIGISEVDVFEVSTGKALLKLKDVGAVNAVAFSPDGRILIAGGMLPENNGTGPGLSFFNLETGKRSYFATGGDYHDAVASLAISRDGDLLALRSGPGSVKLLDTRRGIVKETWDETSVGDVIERRRASRFLLSVTRVLAVAFSADGNTVSGESDRGEIKLWDTRTGETKQHLSIEQENPSLVAASADGKSFAEVTDGELFLWNANSEEKRAVALPGQPAVSALALSVDGELLAVGSARSLSLLSLTGEVVKNLQGQEGSISRLAFSDDQRTLAGADASGTVKIWDIASGRIENRLSVTEVTTMAFAPNAQTLAIATKDNSISIWNVRTGVLQAKFHKQESIINALAFSANGQWLASGSDDRTIVLWEAATGKSKRTLKGHEQTVSALAFSRDGHLLASGGGNGSVVLWEVETGKLQRILE